MRYTISQAAKKIGVTVDTMRYYDREGLLPFVERTPAGQRSFQESDFEWLAVITCLKSTGMPIKNIKVFIDYCMEGDTTLEKRLELFQRQKECVLAQMAVLQKHLDKINYKIWYYETAIAAGTEAVHANGVCQEEMKKIEVGG